jgi:hypothetical protein
MPNWCYNYATFSHEDPAEVTKLKEAVLREDLLDTFVPCPQELKDSPADRLDKPALISIYGYSSWYDFNCGEWGTKWDIATVDIVDDTESNSITFSFDTAWSPPVAFYEKMVEKGWTIDAEYTEEGMGFVGYFTNEDGDEYFELDFESFDEDWKKDFPERLHEMVERDYESWLEMNQDEETVND